MKVLILSGALVSQCWTLHILRYQPQSSTDGEQREAAGSSRDVPSSETAELVRLFPSCSSRVGKVDIKSEWRVLGSGDLRHGFAPIHKRGDKLEPTLRCQLPPKSRK